MAMLVFAYISVLSSRPSPKAYRELVKISLYLNQEVKIFSRNPTQSWYGKCTRVIEPKRLSQLRKCLFQPPNRTATGAFGPPFLTVRKALMSYNDAGMLNLMVGFIPSIFLADY